MSEKPRFRKMATLLEGNWPVAPPMPAESEWWVSGKRMTVWVRLKGREIVEAAPVVRKFTGQPFENLTRWIGRDGGFKLAMLRPVSMWQLMPKDSVFW